MESDGAHLGPVINESVRSLTGRLHGLEQRVQRVYCGRTGSVPRAAPRGQTGAESEAIKGETEAAKGKGTRLNPRGSHPGDIHAKVSRSLGSGDRNGFQHRKQSFDKHSKALMLTLFLPLP